MTRRDWIEEKLREVDRLGRVATNLVVPSRRDFTQFIGVGRGDLALVPRLKRCDPQTGGEWPGKDLAALARVLDETEVAALAICTAAVHGAAVEDLAAVRVVASAPLLRDDLCMDPAQVYESRLLGADAVRIPMAELDAEAVENLIGIAQSVHMTPVLELIGPNDLARVPLRGVHCVGLAATGVGGRADLPAIRATADRVPRNVSVILLSEVADLAAAASLRGLVDAVVVGDALLSSPDPLAEIERFVTR